MEPGIRRETEGEDADEADDEAEDLRGFRRTVDGASINMDDSLVSGYVFSAGSSSSLSPSFLLSSRCRCTSAVVIWLAASAAAARRAEERRVREKVGGARGVEEMCMEEDEEDVEDEANEVRKVGAGGRGGRAAVAGAGGRCRGGSSAFAVVIFDDDVAAVAVAAIATPSASVSASMLGGAVMESRRDIRRVEVLVLRGNPSPELLAGGLLLLLLLLMLAPVVVVAAVATAVTFFLMGAAVVLGKKGGRAPEEDNEDDEDEEDEEGKVVSPLLLKESLKRNLALLAPSRDDEGESTACMELLLLSVVVL